jgi:hypothetical protein
MLALLAMLLVQVEPEPIGPPAPAPSLAGYYAFTGRNPDGEEYRGVATLSPSGAGYRLLWLYDDGKVAAATATLDGDRLIAGWGNGVGTWVVKVEDGVTTLHGKFNLSGQKNGGTETLTFLRKFWKEL